MLRFINILLHHSWKSFLVIGVLTTSLYAQNQSPVKLKLEAGGWKGNLASARLSIAIPQGWHVYAPTPQGKDAAGFEPTLTWDKSSNLQNMKVLWPSSLKTEIQGQHSYVYKGMTHIPLQLSPQHSQNAIALNLKVSLLACSSLCIPIEETLSLTLASKDTESQVKAVPNEKEVTKSENEEEEIALLSVIIIALLGGIILNFMPCVLPVLSLKVISLIKQSKKSHIHHAKQGFFITGLGILASFLLLALFTIILKESGEAFGWGIHFQNPHFLLFVFLVLIAFTACLWGVFEIDLPSGFGTWLIGHEGKGKVKDFLSGVFATLLATPCSAPFVGTALSFALAQENTEIALIFFCLGLGFAFPYFLVASLPNRYIVFPKPGVWMMWVQWILGAGLAITALWVGWVLSFHLPLWTLLVSTALALVALSLFWIKHHKSPHLKAWLFAAPLFCIAWALAWIPLKEESPSSHPLANGEENALGIWQPFGLETIQTLVKQGKFVFVDVTAGWCVTCAVNKNLVLKNPEIVRILSRSDVVAMRADWTKKDAAITSFLQDHNRYGIPFNIIFSPSHPEGLPLPEILTISGVQEVFKKAGLSSITEEVSHDKNRR